MSQKKTDEIFNDMPNVFDITDDIIVVGYGYDDRYYNTTVQKVLQRCRKVNLKLNKDKCHFTLTSIPILCRDEMEYNQTHRKIKVLMEMPLPNNKRELQTFLGIINYLSKFSPSMASICENFEN